MDGAPEDLGSIPLEEGSEWSSPDGSRQGGTMSDGSGRKVNVHPSGGGFLFSGNSYAGSAKAEWKNRS